MENQVVHLTKSNRRIYNWKIFVIHLLAVTTYFMTIYFINNSHKDKNFYSEESNFTILSEFKETFYSLCSPFNNTFYNHILKKIFLRSLMTICCLCLIHILIFRIDSGFYIMNCNSLYSFGLCFNYYHGASDFFLTYLIAVFFFSFVIHFIGMAEYDVHVMLLSSYSRIFFDNILPFIFLITFSLSYSSLVLYLFVFKTVDYFESLIVKVGLFFIVLWIFDWIISLVEVFTTSVTMFYLINRHSESKKDILLESIVNTFYCLGNISVGKWYFYLANTFNFILNTLTEETSYFQIGLEIVLFTLLVLFTDAICFFTHTIRAYVLPYISIHNVRYSKAVRQTQTILVENMYLRLFDNIYLKTIFFMILILLYPVLYDSRNQFNHLNINNIDIFKTSFIYKYKGLLYMEYYFFYFLFH